MEEIIRRRQQQITDESTRQRANGCWTVSFLCTVPSNVLGVIGDWMKEARAEQEIT